MTKAAAGGGGPRILARETAHSGYLTVTRLSVRLGDGSEAQREVEGHGNAVAVLPFDPERRTALVVRLFRPAVLEAAGQVELEEACAGMLDGDEAPEAAARREAEEELGVRLGALEPAGRVWSSPGVSTERVSLFLATYRAADRLAPGGGAEGEHELITVVERPLDALAAEADRGEVADLKLMALLLALRVRRPELFEG